MVRYWHFLLALCLLCCAKGSANQTLIVPPEPYPVKVEMGFELINLVSINERDETFLADINFSLKWKDSRNAFAQEGNTPQIYINDTAKVKLDTIWSPDLEFMNSSGPEIANRTLYMYPDGTIIFYQAMNATFRNKFDFRKFPFDQQDLKIKIRSFVWNDTKMQFVINPKLVGYAQRGQEDLEDVNILNIEAKVLSKKFPRGQEGEEYSNAIFTITVKRNPNFYLYQIFVPLIIVLIVACSIFFTSPLELSNRLFIGLTCLLVNIAQKFTINQDLPEIGYLTIVDDIFFLSYICSGMTVAVSVVEYQLAKKKHRLATKFDKHASWIVPVLFIVTFIIFFIIK